MGTYRSFPADPEPGMSGRELVGIVVRAMTICNDTRAAASTRVRLARRSPEALGYRPSAVIGWTHAQPSEGFVP